MLNLKSHERIIVALDFSSAIEARLMVKDLADHVGGFKIGLELITAIGAPAAIRLVHAVGAKCFFDGKFCDISNTVAKASAAVSNAGVWAFNLHANCGRESIKAAVANANDSLVLGVTVLTSIDHGECQQIYGSTPKEKVLEFATTLMQEGANGIICSPEEISAIRGDARFDEMILVTPGVRPLWSLANDQKRISTPAQVVEQGGDYMVIGRPITQADSPVEAVEKIIHEIENRKTFID